MVDWLFGRLSIINASGAYSVEGRKAILSDSTLFQCYYGNEDAAVCWYKYECASVFLILVRSSKERRQVLRGKRIKQKTSMRKSKSVMSVVSVMSVMNLS